MHLPGLCLGSAGGKPRPVHTWLIPGLYWQETFEGDTSGWTFAGDYEPDASNSAQSSTLDATTWDNTQLVVTRHLNVQGDDTATIAVFTNGTTPVYGNDGASGVPAYLDEGAATGTGTAFYLVRGANPCGQEGP